jgi:hypothetical protein
VPKQIYEDGQYGDANVQNALQRAKLNGIFEKAFAYQSA